MAPAQAAAAGPSPGLKPPRSRARTERWGHRGAAQRGRHGAGKACDGNGLVSTVALLPHITHQENHTEKAVERKGNAKEHPQPHTSWAPHGGPCLEFL